MGKYSSWKFVYIILSILLINISIASAEVVSEISVFGGYTSNLFFDSSRLNDSYSSINPNFKYYPSSTVELSLSGSYTAYSKYSDLSNFSGLAGISLIPLDESLPYSLIISGQVFNRLYGDYYDSYDNYGLKTSILGIYRIKPTFHARTGGSLYTTDYNNATSGDYDGFDLFAGLNTTLPGNNSLNLESGYNYRKYQNYSSNNTSGNGNQNFDIDSKFNVIYLSARISRPLGPKTGLSINYTESSFIGNNDPIVYGFSIDYLTPWASLWDGRSVTVKLKNFSIPNVILEGGVQYTQKYFVAMLEESATEEDYILTNRDDKRANLFLNIEIPFTTGKGKLIKPSILIEYLDNSSNLDLYDYSYLNLSAGINFRL